MKDNVISESTAGFYDELGEYGLYDDFDNEAMNQDTISALPAAEAQASEIDKLYAAYMIADAIRTVCGDDEDKALTSLRKNLFSLPALHFFYLTFQYSKNCSFVKSIRSRFA